MFVKFSTRSRLPLVITLAQLTLVPTLVSAESLAATKRAEYAPTQAITHNIGSKSMHGYYVETNGACSVVLMITENIDPETSTPFSAARVRVLLQPGEIAGVDSAEGRSLNITCGQAAASLRVEEGETSSLTTVRVSN